MAGGRKGRRMRERKGRGRERMVRREGESMDVWERGLDRHGTSHRVWLPFIISFCERLVPTWTL